MEKIFSIMWDFVVEWRSSVYKVRRGATPEEKRWHAARSLRRAPLALSRV